MASCSLRRLPEEARECECQCIKDNGADYLEHLLHVVQTGLRIDVAHESGLRIACPQMAQGPLAGTVHCRLRSDVFLDIAEEGPG